MASEELKARFRRSRAEVLYCLDVLIHNHFNDEERSMTWLANGIPDGTLEKPPTDEQVAPYFDFLEDDSTADPKMKLDYDYFVKFGVSMLYHECFKSTYERGSLT